jgi:hypothetical protein
VVVHDQDVAVVQANLGLDKVDYLEVYCLVVVVVLVVLDLDKVVAMVHPRCVVVSHPVRLGVWAVDRLVPTCRVVVAV